MSIIALILLVAYLIWRYSQNKAEAVSLGHGKPVDKD